MIHLARTLLIFDYYSNVVMEFQLMCAWSTRQTRLDVIFIIALRSAVRYGGVQINHAFGLSCAFVSVYANCTYPYQTAHMCSLVRKCVVHQRHFHKYSGTMQKMICKTLSTNYTMHIYRKDAIFAFCLLSEMVTILYEAFLRSIAYKKLWVVRDSEVQIT